MDLGRQGLQLPTLILSLKYEFSQTVRVPICVNLFKEINTNLNPSEIIRLYIIPTDSSLKGPK